MCIRNSTFLQINIKCSNMNIFVQHKPVSWLKVVFQRARTGADPRQLRHHFHPQPYALRVTSSTYRAEQLSQQTLRGHTFQPPCDSTLLRRTTSWDGFETNAFLIMYAGWSWLFSKPTVHDVINVSQEEGSICFNAGMVNLKDRSFYFQVLGLLAQVVKRTILLMGLVTLWLTALSVIHTSELDTLNSSLQSMISPLNVNSSVSSKSLLHALSEGYTVQRMHVWTALRRENQLIIWLLLWRRFLWRLVLLRRQYKELYTNSSRGLTTPQNPFKNNIQESWDDLRCHLLSRINPVN